MLQTVSGTSRELPSVWIDRLFERFATMYGKHWLDQWAGIDLDAVKQTWRDDLAFATGEQIRKALDHCKLHCKFPPTCPEFAGLCKSFAVLPDNSRALPDYSRSNMPPHIRAEIAKLFDAQRKRDPKDWARQILKDAALGTYRHNCGIEMAERALGLAG